jgi:hypothetical protein
MPCFFTEAHQSGVSLSHYRGSFSKPRIYPSSLPLSTGLRSWCALQMPRPRRDIFLTSFIDPAESCDFRPPYVFSMGSGPGNSRMFPASLRSPYSAFNMFCRCLFLYKHVVVSDRAWCIEKMGCFATKNWLSLPLLTSDTYNGHQTPGRNI